MLLFAIAFFGRTVMLLALLRLLAVTDKHYLCAVISWVYEAVFLLIFGNHLDAVLFRMLFFIPLASIYFWLLHRFEDRLAWWVILPIGFGLANIP